jgi:alkylhydroperoxidase family enzyme
MVSRIESIEPGAADDDAVNELLRDAADGWYGDAAFFGAMAHQPAVFERIVATLRTFPQSDALSPELLELVRLKVADVHRCTYCATVRTEAVADGVAPKEDAVFGTVDGDRLTHREALAVRVAEQLSTDPQTITDADIETLRTVFGDAALVELLLFVSLEIGLDRFCIALTLDTTARSRYPNDLDYPFDPAESRD